jgi:TadE-like protein
MLLQGGKTYRPRTRGAQLLEVALVLPLLLILAVGILDFGTAYNLRHILNNAAREGARLGSSQPTSSPWPAQPPSVQAICNEVVAYLWQANVNLDPAKSGTSFLGPLTAAPPPLPGQPAQPPTCSLPAPAASTNCPPAGTASKVFAAWVYPSGTTACGTGLTIERQIDVPNPGGGVIPSTRVTLNYPYNWLYGFNNVIGFFGAKYSGTIQLYTNAIMANLN